MGTSGELTSNALVEREASFGREFRTQYPLVWWGTLLGPFVLSAAVLVVLWIVRGWDFVLQLLGTALVTFFGLGRFVILLGSDRARTEGAGLAEASEAARFKFMTAFELFCMVTWMDLCAATLLVFHAGFLFKLPKLGPRLLTLREEGVFFMQYQPWMRRFTLLGLTLFVMFPLAATGSVAGSIFGQLLGMHRKSVLLAIVLGTLVGNGSMYFFGGLIRRLGIFDPSNPWNLIGGAVLIIAVIAFLGYRYNAMKKQLTQGRRSADGGGPAPAPPTTTA